MGPRTDPQRTPNDGSIGAQGPPDRPASNIWASRRAERRSQCLTLQLERADGIALATRRRQASGRAHERRLWRASGRAGGRVKTKEGKERVLPPTTDGKTTDPPLFWRRSQTLTRVWLRSYTAAPTGASQQPRSGAQAVARFAFTTAQTVATATALVAVEHPYSHAGATSAVHTGVPPSLSLRSRSRMQVVVIDAAHSAAHALALCRHTLVRARGGVRLRTSRRTRHLAAVAPSCAHVLRSHRTYGSILRRSRGSRALWHTHRCVHRCTDRSACCCSRGGHGHTLLLTSSSLNSRPYGRAR